MKLPPPAIVLFLISPVSGELLSPSPPDSVTDRKKPASIAGFLYLRLSMTRLSALFLPAAALLPLRLAPFS